MPTERPQNPGLEQSCNLILSALTHSQACLAAAARTSSVFLRPVNKSLQTRWAACVLKASL